ncbi:MobF family relaxase [Streptomyces sp. NBC_01506]|uniref:MobF family relaxase n=1 Tax=Streptomyces sp. NBC_01506 TaxID=2903887 RepID=UPI002F90B9B8
MAWLTKITADEQVEYRLREQAGCSVSEQTEDAVAILDDGVDQALEYRLRPEGDAALVWMGSGLAEVGLVEGAVLDDAGKDAARRLMAGCHPATGARLIRTSTSVKAHEKAQLTTARLIEAIVAAAEERGVEPAALLEGKPKQQRFLAQQQRMVHRFGERHRMQVGTLHKLARAAGVDLADVYGEKELAEAWAYKDVRVDDRVRGWDLVLDLPKSDSALQALMNGLDEREYRDLVHQAKADTFRQLEAWVGYAVGSEDGQPVRLATGGLMAWSVEHQSARPMGDGQPGDPHLHVHVTVANMALCEDGKWRSIANSGQDLHRHASALDAYFKARVRALTYARFGVRRELVERTGAWEITGIPEELRSEFSRRHVGIVAQAGDEATRQERDRVSAESKRAKHAADASTMRESWRQRAEDTGIDVDAMVAAAAPGPPGPGGGTGVDGPPGPRIPPPAPSDVAAIVFDPDTGLTRSEKTFSRAQLLAAVGNALEYGLPDDPGLLDQLADEVLAIEGYAVRVPDVGSTVMTSTARYTTQDILAAEDVVTTQALARVGEGTAMLGADQAATAIDVFEVAAGYELSAEQRAAVTRLLTAGHGIDAVVGVAGAGKSTLMEACRIGWDATGTTYAGACLSAVGAQNLSNASGIASKTIAAWLKDVDGGKGLRGVDVLVVDEATMVDDRSAAVLMTEAAKTGTKIVAIGDHLQLQAIGPGGWFRETHRLVGGLTLTENRRQEDAAERAALEVWRTGNHEQALTMLAAGGRVHASESADEARSQILTAWDELRTRWSDSHDLIDNMVVLAARNTDVDALNLGAQQIRRAAGELGTEHGYALPGGERLTLAVGDAVRVRANDYRSKRGQGPDLLNGYRAVVTDMDADRRVEITWRTRGGGHESAWLTPDQIAGGALSLGYAMTIAASQGLTCDTSLLYGHGANAFATYPGITRARRENHLWLPLAVIEDESTQARLGAARSEKERLERAVTAFARFLGQSRPDSMVSDLLREPPEPARLPAQVVRADDFEARQRALERRADAAAATSPSVRLPEQQEAVSGPYTAGLSDEHLARLEAIDKEREQREIPSWKKRPYGRPSGQKLARVLRDNEDAAGRCDRAAAAADREAEEIRERLDEQKAAGQTRGQKYVGEAREVLGQAEELLATARREAGAAATAAATAAQITGYIEQVKETGEKGRLALRLAGTSRKESKALTREYEGQRAAAWQEEARAKSAARDAGDAAWELLRTDAATKSLVAGQYRPKTTEDLAERLDELRVAVPHTGHRMDVRDLESVARAHGRAVEQRANAVKHRGIVSGVQGEQALRKRIADQHPDLHRQEADQRRELQQQQARRKPPRVEHPRGPEQQLPPPSRGRTR